MGKTKIDNCSKSYKEEGYAAIDNYDGDLTSKVEKEITDDKIIYKVKEELEGNKETYKEEIRIMQDHIRKITDKSVKIQSQEARNKALMTNKFNGIKKQARQVRKGANVASKYYQSMTKTGYVDPQFMDNKK